MSLREKFLPKTAEGKECVLLCSSTYHMLKADKLLQKEGIQGILVPAPRGIGSACTTAIKFKETDRSRVEELINQYGISWEAIHLLEKKDRKISWTDVYKFSLRENFKNVLRKLEDEVELTKEDIVILLATQDKEEMEALFLAADRVREECVGDEVDVRGVIEFSNFCRKDCLYCGVRKSKKYLPRYRMTEDEIMEQVKNMETMGLRTVALQSGEDPWYTTEKIVTIIKRIRKETQLTVTLSVGERSKEDYERFFEAGSNAYLLKIESANRGLFQTLHPDDDYDLRKKHTIWLRQSGYLVGSGNMVGLPGQTLEHLAEDILFLKEYAIHMVSIGPFLPARGTPFVGQPAGDLFLTLRVIAVARLVCQNIFMPATTAIATLHPKGQTMALTSGTNVIMLIMTPEKLQSGYQIYDNKNSVDLEFAIKSIKESGRKFPAHIRPEYLEMQGLKI